MSKYLLIVFSFVLLGSPSVVFAQESDTTTTTIAEVTPTAASSVRTQVQNAVNSRTQAITKAKDEAKDKMMEAREAFKQKITEIKDQQKLNRITNLDSKLNQINKRRTDQMSEKLGRLTDILSRLSVKAAALKSDGKNTAALESSIETAQEAVDAAKTAVAEQAAKDYIITITTESALKTNASATVKQFSQDIKAVHKEVVEAQQAVRETFEELKELEGTPVTTPAASE